MSAAGFDRFLWRSAKTAPDRADTTVHQSSQTALRVRDSGGAGMPLVFLCDPPVTVDAYDELMELLSPDYRVLVIELPGFGFSPAYKNDALSFAGTVEAIEATLLQLLDQPAVIFGPCICGFVATELSRRDTLPMAGVVLMQTPDYDGMVQWRNGMDPKKLLRKPFLGQLLVKLKAKSLVPFWLKFATAKAFDHAPLTKTTMDAMNVGAGYSLATMFQRWNDGLQDTVINHPALIVWGNQDRSHANTDHQCSRKHCPDAELVEFAQCGHFSELEDPAAFVEAVQPFLAELLAQP